MTAMKTLGVVMVVGAVVVCAVAVGWPDLQRWLRRRLHVHSAAALHRPRFDGDVADGYAWACTACRWAGQGYDTLRGARLAHWAHARRVEAGKIARGGVVPHIGRRP